MGPVTNKTAAIGALLVLMAVTALPAAAQQPIDSGGIIIIDPTAGSLSRKPSPLEQAERLMRMGDFTRAAAVLEAVLEKAPTFQQAAMLLAACYENRQDYGRLLILLNRRATIEPPSYALYRDLGRAHLLSGSADSAKIYFFRAADYVERQTDMLAEIAETYQRLGQYRMEAEFIDSMRVRFGNARLMAGPMGDALATQRQYRRATEEYLIYLEQDTVTARDAENKIIALVQYGESGDTVMAVLGARLQGRPNPRLLKMYGQILMERGRYPDAYTFFLLRDSLDQGSGSDVLYFMQECVRRDRFDYAVQAGEYFLRQYPESGLATPARFLIAQGYTALRRYHDALTVLTAILDNRDRTSARIEAHLRLGQLLKDYLNDPTAAGDHLGEVHRGAPGTRFDSEALLGLADIYVHQRNFDSAVALYQTLVDREGQEDLAEAAEFLSAQANLYKGSFDEAGARFRRLINRYPHGLYVNDAIQYSLILSETQEQAPKQLDLFGAAEFYRRINQADSLEYYLIKICRVQVPSLAPLAYLHLGELYRERDRRGEAMAAADSLTALYPESYYVPYGMKLKADILWRSPSDREQAMALYRELLEKFGTYPFAAEIRDLLRRNPSLKQS